MNGIVLSDQQIKSLAENIAKNLNLLDPPEFFSIDLLSPLKDFFKWLGEQVVNIGINVINFLKVEVLEKIENGIKWFVDWIVNKIKNIINTIIDTIKNLFYPASPERVITQAGIFSITFLGLGFGVNALISFLQTQILGNRLNLQPLANYINRILNPALFFNITLGILLSRGLEVPLRYWANNFFRPYFPSPREAWLLYRLGHIDQNTYLKIFGYVGGYPETFRKGLEDLWSYNLTISHLFRIARVLNVPESWLVKHLLRRGVDDEDIKYILKAVFLEPVRDERERVANDLYTLYMEGWLSKEDLMNYLTQLEFRSDEIVLRVLHADLLRMRYLKRERAEVFILLFRRDLITIEELKRGLLSLGLSLENVNIICDQELARKGRKLVYEVTQKLPETYINLTSQLSTSILS